MTADHRQNNSCCSLKHPFTRTYVAQFAWVFVPLVFLANAATPAQAAYEFINLTPPPNRWMTGSADSVFSVIGINDNREVAFTMDRDVLVYRSGTTAAVGSNAGSSANQSVAVINNAGVVAYAANNGTSIATSDGRTIVDSNGAGFAITVPLGINSNGDVLFGTNDGQLLLGNGSSFTVISDRNTPIIDVLGREITVDISAGATSCSPCMANSGALVFRGTIAAGGDGLFVLKDGELRQVTNTPEFPGDPQGAERYGINDDGTVVFGGGGNGLLPGVYTADGQTQTTVADTRTSDLLEITHSSVGIGSNGHVVFNPAGNIFVGPDPINDLVISPGDELFGGVVSWTNSVAINNHGDIAFRYSIEGQNDGVALARLITVPGSIPEDPILPTSISADGTLNFDYAKSGDWFDPPAVDQIEYTMTSDASFTSILNFPSGFEDEFEVLVDGSSLGVFGPGDSVNFQEVAPDGVKSFRVSGITPLVDSENPVAFPLQLAFSTDRAQFQMQFVPEPHSGLLASFALIIAPLLRRRKIDKLVR